MKEETIDRACKRILTVKFRRGLFENPFVPETDHWQSYNAESYPQVKRLAEQTPVLLKNETGVLPLNRGQKIALIGPNADAIYNQLGDYTPPLRQGRGTTLRRGLEKLGAKVICHPGCPMFGSDEALLKEAVELARDCDVIVAAVGGSSSRFAIAGEFDTNGALKSQERITMDCGENVDNASLRLPGEQLRLLEQLRETGKPLVTVLIAGRPYEMGTIDRVSDAILCSFYPGPTGGEALAGLLLGDLEPAGRLSVSLPDDATRLPVYYNPKDSYRPMAYYDGASLPQYPFGAGLSYTRFDYSLISAPEKERREVICRVTNTGSRPGWAVPQLYIHRLQGVATSRRRQLVSFEKFLLSPGESREVRLPIPEESLIQWDYRLRPTLAPGSIHWYLADSGKEHLDGEFTV